MRSHQEKFGRLPQKCLSKPKSKPTAHLSSHTSNEEIKETAGERGIAWLSYMTMVYAATVVFAPSSAAAAVNSVRGLVG